MKPATDAQRKAKERQSRKDAGLVILSLYVHPEDRQLVRDYVGRLAAKRTIKSTRTDS